MLELTTEQVAALAEIDAKGFVERVRADLCKADPGLLTIRHCRRDCGGHSRRHVRLVLSAMKISLRFCVSRHTPRGFMNSLRRARG